MKRPRTMKVPHRRKREGKTDYKTRLKLLKSKRTRFVVRKSLKNITCQLVNYTVNGDRTVVSSDSRELKAYGWNASTGNVPAAYLTGLLCAHKAKKHGVKNAILDMGLFNSLPGNRIYSALKGAVDGGLEIPHSEEVMPKQERIFGKHIADYAKKLKQESPARYNSYFSAYVRSKANPEDIGKTFEAAKKNIMEGHAKKAPKAEKPKKAAKK